MNEQTAKLLEDLRTRIAVYAEAYYYAANRSRKTHYTLHTVISTLLITCTSYLAFTVFVADQDMSRAQLLPVTLSITVLALLASIVPAIFRYGEVSHAQYATAGRLNSLRREIETLLTELPPQLEPLPYMSDEAFLSGLSDREIARLQNLTDDLLRYASMFSDIVNEAPALSKDSVRAKTIIEQFDAKRRQKIVAKRFVGGVTLEENIITELRRYGPLPYDFLTKSEGLSDADAKDLVESLIKDGFIEVSNGIVSLKKVEPAT